MPFIGSVEGACGYGRGSNGRINKLVASAGTYIPAQGTTSESCIDTNNNYYLLYVRTATTTDNILNFNRSQSSITLPNYNTICLIKYDPSGNVVWANCLSDIAITTTSNSVRGIDYDNSGNVYIFGNYASTSSISLMDTTSTGQTISTTGVTLPSTTSTSINYSYLVKYDSSGKVVWGTYNIMSGNSKIKVDSTNNIYVTIGFTTSATDRFLKIASTTSAPQANSTSIKIPKNTSTNTTVGSIGMIKYSSSGVPLWATYMNTTNTCSCSGLDIDNNNNIYYIGKYIQTLTNFTLVNVTGTTAVTLPFMQTGGSFLGSIFIIKYNSAGTAQCATNILPANMAAFAINSIYCYNTSLYICGEYGIGNNITIRNAVNDSQSDSTIQLQGFTNVSGVITKYLGYVIKFNIIQTRSILAEWATYIGVNDFRYSGGNTLFSITVDSSGNVYTTGPNAPDTRNNTTVPYPSALGNTQVMSQYYVPKLTNTYIVIVKYSSTGTVMNVTYFTNNFGYNSSPRLIADTLNNIYISTRTSSTSVSTTLLNGWGISQNNSEITFTPPGLTIMLAKYYTLL